jgi:RNA polymerase sigma factor (sigma-70 family)
MPRSLSNGTPETTGLQCAARIRAAIADEHEALLRSIAVLVARTQRRLRWPEVLEMASEILHETVQEALKNATRFDPARSATAWVRGIAARLLLSRRRADVRLRRCLPAAVLGDAAWTAVLEQLCTGSADAAIAARLDMEQALERMSVEERHAITLRYYQGLDGMELANALRVATPGAARVRVCRALQSLRMHFRPAEEEVFP